MKRLFCLLALSLSLNGEDPWGRDADLIHTTPPPSIHSLPNNRCSTPIIGAIAEKTIAFHQDVISPADGPRSHFVPSSSQYMLDAIRKYGFFRGFPMGCDRLMRENNDPWVYRKTVRGKDTVMKYDPVR